MSSKKTFSSAPEPISINVPEDLGKDPYVSYWTRDGQRRRVSKGLRSYKTYAGRMDAARKLAQGIRHSFEMAVLPDNPRSLEERAWEWVESRRPYLRKKSYYGYCSKLRIFLKWKQGRKMSRQLVTQYFAFRAESVGGSTLKDDKIYLNRVFTSISDADYFGHLDLPRAHSVTRAHYRPSQQARIKDYLQEYDPELWFVCQCVCNLFIRPGSELRLLKVHHFDLDEWRVHIPPSVSKNKKSEYILIPTSFRPDVQLFLEEKMPNEYIFPGKFDKSKPIGANTFITRYRKHMQYLGFGFEYTLYGWKNTGAIEYVKRNINPKVLQKMMRHSSLEMTDRYLNRLGLVHLDNIADELPSI